MNTLQTLVGAALSLIGSWKPNTNIQNDVEDAILTLNAAQNAGISAKPLGGAVFKEISKDAASFENLASGQIAEGFVVGASFDGHPDKVLIFAVRQYADLTPPVGSPAEALKKMLGY